MMLEVGDAISLQIMMSRGSTQSGLDLLSRLGGNETETQLGNVDVTILIR